MLVERVLAIARQRLVAIGAGALLTEAAGLLSSAQVNLVVVCASDGMSRSGNVWDNAAMESFFSSLKTERTARKTYRTRDQAKADVFDYTSNVSTMPGDATRPLALSARWSSKNRGR